MIRLLAALLALCLPVSAVAQLRDAAPGIWSRAEGRARFAGAGISAPEQAGPVRLTRLVEFSNHGSRLDNAIQYESADREIFATVYVYSPGRPNSALAAFATGEALVAGSGPELRALGSRLVGAGGHERRAIRADFTSYRGELASSAAFLRTGQWVVKLRVSGPNARLAEVRGTMTALLDGLRFEAGQPHPPQQLVIGDCAQNSSTPARMVPSSDTDTLAEALTPTVDEIAPTFGDSWCVSSRPQVGDGQVPILRARDPASGAGGRTMLVAPIGDAGQVLEAVTMPGSGRLVLFFHQVGKTQLLGAYDAVPSDAQIAAILSGADRAGGRARASLTRDYQGNVQTTVHVDRPTAPTT